MLIRNAKITEGYEIEALVKLCAEDSEGMMITPEETVGAISSAVINKNSRVMVAIHDTKIIGAIIGNLGITNSSAHNMEVAMCIHPEFRGKKVGFTLAQIFVNEFSYLNIYVNISESNTIVLGLLEGLNFKEAGRLPKYIKEKSGYKDKIILFYYG
jgi:ribosomal protein S18 acetylase RimI-like enzyme